MPLISVIIPIYNVEVYLKRCIESVLSQDYPFLEIILIDDGSGDGSCGICLEYSTKYALPSAEGESALKDRKEKFRYIKHIAQENKGTSAARNAGLLASSGEYIAFLDADDYIEPHTYMLLYEACRYFNARCAQIGRFEEDEHGKRLPDVCRTPFQTTIMPPLAFFRDLLLHKGDCSFCTKLFHRGIFMERKALTAGFPEGRLNEDFLLLIKSLENIGNIVSLPKICYHVTYRRQSNSRNADKNDFPVSYWDCVLNADFALKLVKRSYPSLKSHALRFAIFQRLEYILHIPIQMMEKTNEEYKSVVSFIRSNFLPALLNPYLSSKDKIYTALFAIAPRQIRKTHAALVTYGRSSATKNKKFKAR